MQHDVSREHFVETLSSEERMLVVLKRELYEGSWDEMAADLQARLDGRPYIFKLAHRIEDDLERCRLARGQRGDRLAGDREVRRVVTADLHNG